MTEDHIYARRWWTLGALCFSLLIIGMDATILNVALPTLARDLHAGTSSLQWIIDAYTLVYASMLFTTGSLGDRFGRKGALSLGSDHLRCRLGGVGVLRFGRHCSSPAGRLMGLGGCLIMPATLSILTNVFPNEERAKAIGVWAGSPGSGSSPDRRSVASCWATSGGDRSSSSTSQWSSWPSSPATSSCPISKDPSTPRLDPVGTGLSIVGLTVVLYAIIEAPTRGLGNPIVLAVRSPSGVVVVVVFVFWELHTDHPMLDVRFFENPGSPPPRWPSPWPSSP